MEPYSLDHVALWVSDRDSLATFLCERLDVHVIDRTDRYTLVGPSGLAGKLTLFDAVGGTVLRPSRLVSVTLADEDASREPLQTEDGLLLTFAAHPTAERHAVIGATFRCDDPAVSAARYVDGFGFEARGVHPNVATLSVGEGTITLVREAAPDVECPLLNHLGLLVQSAQDHIDEATERGMTILDVVDAPNTYAVFLDGPDGVRIEFVEHKPEFALT